MLCKKKLLVILVVFPFFVESTIHEVRLISQVFSIVQKHVKAQSPKKVLVAFDLCNTLICPKEYKGWGSDHWLDAHAQRLIRSGIEPFKAWNALLPLYYEIQGHPAFTFESIEPETVRILENIKKSADITIGLTARSLPIIQATLHRLDAAKISFKESSFSGSCSLQQGASAYQDGVLFCGPINKGKVLLEWFELLNYWPAEIIIVDDKIKNLHAIEQAFVAAHKPDITLTLLHYTHLKDTVAEYDLDHFYSDQL